MKHVFLESHNIKNQFNGFGQFNYHLINGLYNAQIEDFKITLNAKNTTPLKDKYGNYFNYKTYKSLSRKPLFRIKKKYDVWHSLNQNIKVEPFFNIPYVLTVHDVNFVDEVSNNMDHKVNRRFKEKLKRSHAITYISEFAKQSTHKHFDVPNVPEYVIYNGNPISELQTDFKAVTPVTKRPFLFFIGGLTVRKNPHTLVQMLEHLPDFDLVLAGSTKDDYTTNVLETAIAKTNTKHQIHILGKISSTEKHYYYKHCAALVFPSLLEGFGLPPIEVMSYGKPVFLSNLTSLPEIGGKHAFYWDNFDPKYMANVLIEGLHKYETNKAFYINTYQERAKSFNWDTAALHYADVYRSLF
ncbi:glycosyltransferase family 4 protein [Mesoflavibacter profundi]|uniref:glycosyltransferase family 4 protein n=1 Tax=Mesoflavibacter profundi TaxID=2708110 RepID=UPI00168AFEA0|nr:glycosyltransferase family 1 protein [Mesoflavibacter profundi]